MADSPVYIAGVGISHLQGRVSDSNVQELTISAGTKALLDAGITYGDVKANIATFLGDDLKVPKSCFQSFGKTGVPISKVEGHSGLFIGSQVVKSGRTDCVMVIGFDQETPSRKQWLGKRGRIAAVAVIIVSQGFMASHPFLKDSAACIRGSKLAGPVHSRSSESTSETLSTKLAIQGALNQAVLAPNDIQIVELRHGSHLSTQYALGLLNTTEDGHASPISNPFVGSTGLAGLCELVWQLRGWTKDRSVPGTRNCLQYTLGPDGTAYVTIICRANGNPTPTWAEIEHVRDGRERLGYNPAFDNKDITHEDWLAVKAHDDYVPEQTAKRLRLPVKGGDRAALARL